MNKTTKIEVTITLTNQDIRDAIAKAVCDKYEGIVFDSDDIVIRGNNDTIECTIVTAVTTSDDGM